jgi:uncharacterized protein YjiS (DUF1127 family)
MTPERKLLSPRAALAAPSYPLSSLISRLFAWIVDAHEIRRQRRALARLENRLLDDIGLTRDDVARELNRSIWK